MSCEFFVEGLRPATLHIGATCVGRHRKTVRHRQLQHAHHLGEVCTFAAEQIFHAHWRATMFVIECKNKSHTEV